jgi:hypothetical protein
MVDPIRYLMVGFPRGGTSMMMQAIDAGGIPVYRSEAREIRLTRYARKKHQGQGPNPGGYWEPTGSDWSNKMFPMTMPSGMAVKMFGNGIERLSRLEGPFKAIHLVRDPMEVMESHIRMFGRPPMRFRTAEQFDGLAGTERAALRLMHTVVSVVEMNYNDIMSDPLVEFTRLAEEWPIDPAAAASVVDPSLYRNKGRTHAAM